MLTYADGLAGDESRACLYLRRLLASSTALLDLPTSARLHAKLGLALRAATLTLQAEEDEEGERKDGGDGAGGGSAAPAEKEKEKEKEKERAVALERQMQREAAQMLARAREEMQTLYGTAHWACVRVDEELQAAIAAAIAASCRHSTEREREMQIEREREREEELQGGTSVVECGASRESKRSRCD